MADVPSGTDHLARAARLHELVADVERLAPLIRQALRRDFCAKLRTLSPGGRQRLHEQLIAKLPRGTPGSIIDTLCFGAVTAGQLDSDAELMQLVDAGAAVAPLLEASGDMRRSYLSLQVAWEQLAEWCDAAADVSSACRSEEQLLAHLGVLAQPIEVKRLASGASPYAIEVTRVCATPGDTASFCTALNAKQRIVPPEGGAAVEDLLVLVDPAAPRASRLALSSKLLKETYASMVLHRNLHSYGGLKIHLALHGHSLFHVVQPPPPGIRREDLEAQLRRQYLGRAYQCARCRFGPIDHFACGDLAYHNGERVGNTTINNACPRCAWFSRALSDWPKWDGTVPEEALSSCIQPGQAETSRVSAAAAELALRICYSARAIWQPGEDGGSQSLCNKLANWETLTADDGVEHPVQLLLALAVADELPEGVLGRVPVAALLNEVCARRAEGELSRMGGDAARSRLASFLGILPATVPRPSKLTAAEPSREAVAESCSGNYTLNPDAFDFKGWVRETLTPWTHAICFARRLRCTLRAREGGWRALARDMEAGPGACADVVAALQLPPRSKDSLAALLAVRDQSEAPRVLATMTAQAFLHPSAPRRRTLHVGGALVEPLGDVREAETLRALCVELRMLLYDARVAEKRRRHKEVQDTLDRCGHVHGLNRTQFWELWHSAYGDEAYRFLISANQAFQNKYGADLPAHPPA